MSFLAKAHQKKKISRLYRKTLVAQRRKVATETHAEVDGAPKGLVTGGEKDFTLKWGGRWQMEETLKKTAHMSPGLLEERTGWEM